jgi:polar amino acid transport system ATP-binding protein
MRTLAAQGMTCIVVTHEMKFATSFATEIYLMEKGEIVEHGPPSEIPTSPNFVKTRAFMGSYADE